MQAVPWKSGASAPRKAQNQCGSSQLWSPFRVGWSFCAPAKPSSGGHNLIRATDHKTSLSAIAPAENLPLHNSNLTLALSRAQDHNLSGLARRNRYDPKSLSIHVTVACETFQGEVSRFSDGALRSLCILFREPFGLDHSTGGPPSQSSFAQQNSLNNWR